MKKVIRLTESDLMRIVKRVILEQETKEIIVSPENAYSELQKLYVSPSGMKGIKYQDQIQFGNLIITPINFHLLGRSNEEITLFSSNTRTGIIYQVRWNDNTIISFTPIKDQSYIPDTKYIGN